jgi:hypothetical protein
LETTFAPASVPNKRAKRHGSSSEAWIGFWGNTRAGEDFTVFQNCNEVFYTPFESLAREPLLSLVGFFLGLGIGANTAIFP